MGEKEFATTWPLGNMNVYEQLTERINQLEFAMSLQNQTIEVLQDQLSQLTKFVKGPTLGEFK